MKWPYLKLLASHVFNLGGECDFHEIDAAHLDRTEAQLGKWVEDIAPGIDESALKQKVLVAHNHRYHEGPEANGFRPWFDYVFVFERREVLVEEVLSGPLGDNVSQSPPKLHRFTRKLFAECPESMRRLFPEHPGRMP